MTIQLLILFDLEFLMKIDSKEASSLSSYPNPPLKTNWTIWYFQNLLYTKFGYIKAFHNKFSLSKK